MLVSIKIYFVLCFCKVSCLSRAWLLCCVTCGTAYFTHMHSCCMRGMRVSLCLNSPCTWCSFFTLCAHYHNYFSSIDMIFAVSVVYPSCHFCMWQPQFLLRQIFIVFCVPRGLLRCSMYSLNRAHLFCPKISGHAEEPDQGTMLKINGQTITLSTQ